MEPKTRKAEDNEYITSQNANSGRKAETMDEIGRKLGRLKTEEISLTNSPFHYQIRASTYGDIYDEIGWRVKVDFEKQKPRDGVDRFALIGAYHPTGVRINNWVENQRDKNYVKYGRLPRISAFGYFYETTTNSAYSKRMCNYERYHLQNIQGPFSKGAYPGHQPELDIPVVRKCNPIPESCIIQKEKEDLKKARTRQLRYEKAEAANTQKLKTDSVFNREDLGKCMNR